MNAITQAREMSPAVDREDAGRALSRVILEGDLSRLTDAERVTHYNATCQSIGVNPLTRPLEYIKLNGKLVLYARKDCTDQLRALRKVSVAIVDRTISGDLVMVTARATTPDGRQDEDIGSVPLGSLQGEAKANAIMKAMTKAKRRVTLSICGLGFLDESEVESIQGAAPQDARVVGLAVPDQPALPAPDPAPTSAKSWTWDLLEDQLSMFHEMEEIRAWLAQPDIQDAKRRVEKRFPNDGAARWSALIQKHMSRVLPDNETTAPNEESEQ